MVRKNPERKMKRRSPLLSLSIALIMLLNFFKGDAFQLSPGSIRTPITQFQGIKVTKIMRPQQLGYAVAKVRKRETLTTKSMSNKEDDDSIDAVEAEIVLENTVESRRAKNSQVSSYRTGSLLYAAMALDAIKRRNALSIYSGAAMSMSIVSPISLAAGYLLAAASMHTLISAAEHNRLSSDTYKRMNLSLILFSIINIDAQFTNWPFIGTSALLCQIYNGFTCVNGWLKGIRGLGTSDGAGLTADSLICELRYGMKTTIGGIMKIENRISMGYVLSLAMASLVILHNVIIIPALWGKSLARVNAIRLTATSRLLLVSALIYTLLDASNRGRLKGTTFITLNTALSVCSFAVSGAMLSPLFQSACISSKVLKMASIIAAFASFTGSIGLKSYMEKKNN
mmetsp:Transcript_10941/g.16504  ORF Transcript_10941/g.16504 Transcript_10941/m.16504 type:complete len:398 (+) Transcript_10941:71-1264(+)